MSNRLKGEKVIIEGNHNSIVPKALPTTPGNGAFSVDILDNKFKVWSSAKNRWIILGDASDVAFDNTVALLPESPANVQAAIEALKAYRFQYIQFQFVGDMDYSQYLISNAHTASASLLGSTRRSGDASNGYQYGNSAPLTSCFTGTVKSATASVKGLAVSTGSSSASVTLTFELWKVGFSGEGTKLGDITFTIISGTTTIGTYYNSSISSNFAKNQTQNVNVSAGDLLGLKFKSTTGNSNIVKVTNATVVLEIIGSA